MVSLKALCGDNIFLAVTGRFKVKSTTESMLCGEGPFNSWSWGCEPSGSVGKGQRPEVVGRKGIRSQESLEYLFAICT